MIFTWIATYLTKAVLSGLLGKLWKGFCDFISTPIGAALVAGVIMFGVGVAHEHRTLNAKWQAKWSAAEAQAEKDRLKRDADIKLLMQKDVDARIAALTQRKNELETMVKAYEDQEALQPVIGGKAGPCSPLTNDTDARWLSDAQRKRTVAKPKAQRGFALRLHPIGN